MFRVTDTEDILDGTATDAYFLRTEETLRELEENPEVVAEISADQFQNREFEVVSGVEQCAKLLAEVSDELIVESLPEGSLFDGGPVMRIRGPYLEFARYETSVLGFLSHASGVASAAHRVTQAASEDTSVLSFGARHVHPSLAPTIERNALVGGVDGFSHVSAGQEIGRDASGTMPHALMLSLGEGSQERAWGAFNDAVDDSVPRITLCDTFTDEKDEVRRAVQELGDNLDGVRLDTTGSRRGDFRHIIKEVQWALEQEGHGDVDIFVSGGLGPSDVAELSPLIDGAGVGSYISTAEPIDFSLDIVEREGEPIAKRGKNSGEKEVYRVGDSHVVVAKDSLTEDGTFGGLDGNRYEASDFNERETEMIEIVRDGDVRVDFSIEAANQRREADAQTLLGDYNE